MYGLQARTRARRWETKQHKPEDTAAKLRQSDVLIR